MQVQNMRTELGVWNGKRFLLACHNRWFKQYLFMNFTQVNIFTESVLIEQQE